MPHETGLIATIALGLVFAFAGGFLANRLRLPPLVGYLLAGIAVGPYTPGFVGDLQLAGQLAEIGIILLMFGVGLHFSVDDLLAVRRIAVPGAIVQIAAAIGIGVGVAALWGWGLGAGLVFGLTLSVASTAVLLRALTQQGALGTPNARIAVGWLIVQDVAMVLALVLLPALAGPLGGAPQRLADPFGGENLALTLLFTLAKTVFFVALMLVAGKRVVPWLLAQAARTGSRELFTLCVLALALGIAYGSSALFGVSFALGAFFAGVILAESDLSHQAAADSLPFQDAFAVLFFVSVGMLFDPMVLLREPLPVLAVLAAIMLGNALAAFAIVLGFGYPVATALFVAASLAQIGEFSFILAGRGVALDLLPTEGRDLILAGALLSITLNPLLFAGIGKLNRLVEERPAFGARLHWSRGDGRPLRALAAASGSEEPRDHAILVGYGRVGGVIGRALDAWELPYVVIERDRWRVEELQARGVPAIYGDASAPGILAAAGVERARLLVVAAPDGYQVRRIVEIARKANPEIDAVVRTHSEAELDFLERQGIGLAVLAERELALGMTGYALRSLGLSEGEARMFVQSARRYDDAGLPSDVSPREGAPELRPHRAQDDAETDEVYETRE